MQINAVTKRRCHRHGLTACGCKAHRCLQERWSTRLRLVFGEIIFTQYPRLLLHVSICFPASLYFELACHKWQYKWQRKGDPRQAHQKRAGKMDGSHNGGDSILRTIIQRRMEGKGTTGTPRNTLLEWMMEDGWNRMNVRTCFSKCSESQRTGIRKKRGIRKWCSREIKKFERQTVRGCVVLTKWQSCWN